MRQVTVADATGYRFGQARALTCFEEGAKVARNARHMPPNRASNCILRALEAYDLGEVQDITPIGQGRRNHPHLIATRRGRYVAKLLAPEFSTPPALEARHAFVDHLSAAGVRVPKLARTGAGEGCSRIEAYVMEASTYVDGRRYLAGDAPEAGRSLAELHLASLTFTPPGPGVRRDWLTGAGDLGKIERIEGQMRTYLPAPEMLEQMFHVKQSLQAAARLLSEADLPAAIVHGSVFPENLVVDGNGAVWLTDFDRCHRAPLVLEIATASGELGARAIQGYQDVRPLTDAERELLPAAVTRVTIHLGLARGESVQRIAQRLA